MKKFLLFFSIVFYVCLSYAYDIEVGGIYYYYNASDQSVSVTSYDNGQSHLYCGTIVIPDTILFNGRKLPVLSIGTSAFRNCVDLRAVALPSILNWIGDRAFENCYELTSIVFPSSLGHIGAQSFKNCKKLKNLEISCDYISNDAFNNCIGLEHVKINTSSIGPQSFIGCSGLKAIVITGNVEFIDEKAFSGCSGVERFVLEDSETILRFSNTNMFSGMQPKFLFLGRNRNYYSYGQNLNYCYFINCPDSSILSIGKYVKNTIQIGFNNCFYKKVYSMIENPDQVQMEFSNSTYLNAILYVPIGAKERYQSSNGWKNFFNIEEMAIEDMWHGEVEIPDDPDPFPYPDPDFLKCDVNGDGEVNIADINTIVEAILSH